METGGCIKCMMGIFFKFIILNISRCWYSKVNGYKNDDNKITFILFQKVSLKKVDWFVVIILLPVINDDVKSVFLLHLMSIKDQIVENVRVLWYNRTQGSHSCQDKGNMSLSIMSINRGALLHQLNS